MVAWEALLLLGVSGDHPWFGLAASGVAFWGALGPDMDHPMATWAQSFPGGKTWAKIVAHQFGGHRQGTHSLVSIVVAWLLIAIPLWIIDVVLVWNGVTPFGVEYISTTASAFATGWTAHILGDMLTVQGVGLFYPYSRRRFRFANLRTSPTKKLNLGEASLVFATYCAGAVLTINLLGGIA